MRRTHSAAGGLVAGRAAHAASAFSCSPFESAAILCVDGVGEWATTSLWRGTPGAMEPPVHDVDRRGPR
ncbi:MAG: hypothetical protein EXR69_14395 [Myxococcales bacterium]|nr:hypothetical protein [Myxococcales bacterium]